MEVFYRKQSQLKDLRGALRVIDSRIIDESKEFLCVFPHEREEWLEVPADHPILDAFFKHVDEEEKKGVSGVLIVEDMKTWCQPDWIFIDGVVDILTDTHAG